MIAEMKKITNELPIKGLLITVGIANVIQTIAFLVFYYSI